MAKKKKDKISKPPKKTFSEVLGIDRITSVFHHERINFVIGFILLAVAVFITLSFVSFFTTGSADVSYIESAREGDLIDESVKIMNYCGTLGAHTAYFFIKQCFGVAAFLIPAFLIILSLRLMRVYKFSLLKSFFLFMLLMVWLSVALGKLLEPLFADSYFAPGGDHGKFTYQWIEKIVGEPGLIALLAIIAISLLTYISKKTIYFIRRALNPIQYFNDRKVKFEINTQDNDDSCDGINDNEQKEIIETLEDPEVFDDPETQEVIFDEEQNNNDKNEEDNSEVVDLTNIDVKKDETVPADKEVEMDIEVGNTEEKAKGTELVRVDNELAQQPYDPKKDLLNYHYPTLDLLKKYETDGKPYIDMEEQTANKNRIVEVLRNFGVEISSIKATVGPTITLYEITPAPGVRISKIRNLEDDIALSLSALGIRIIAPIPGKGTIGIEVPNAKPSIVSMESILNSKKFQETTMDLPCAIGKTITNEVYMFDLAKAPHLLVAGATGQGKSVGLNAIITSLLYKKHPAELKIVLVDPKKVEFSVYANIDKHFLAKVPDEDSDPIITDVTKVVRTLNSLCKEMDTRYDLLKTAQVRNLKEYNKKFSERRLNPEKGHRFLPYIVVIIDEFGDLIMTAGREVELPIARIAQLARAVGIHMIIATQRPTTNIITGTIKANFPSRIAFRVGAMIDSRTILDRPGAQQLVGRGDMLYLNGGEPVRVQCAFVDTPEVERINQYISQQQGYLYTFELPEPDMPDGEDGGSSADVDMQHLDPLFEDAARLIVTSQSGSTSLIQRKFSIGYNRAGRLMDQLEKAGLVGAAHGAKPREVLIQDENSLNNLLISLRG